MIKILNMRNDNNLINLKFHELDVLLLLMILTQVRL